MHYEVELGVIMGKTLRDLHPDDEQGAFDSIEGMFRCVCKCKCFDILFWGRKKKEGSLSLPDSFRCVSS